MKEKKKSFSQNRGNSNRYRSNKRFNKSSHKQNTGQGQGRSHYRRYRSRSSNSDLMRRWHDLYDKHAQARKRFYNQFEKVSPERRKNLEREFFRACENLRKFESGLNEQEKLTFYKVFPDLKPDNTYSSNHSLDTTGETPEKGPHLDPHLTPIQTNRPSYAQDTQESVGTIEDYLNLKKKPAK